MEKITIIGGGNLGTSIAKGLLNSGFYESKDLTITKRNIEVLKVFAEKGVTVTSDNLQAIKTAQWIILAVKPYQIEGISKEIAPFLTKDQKIISVITGVFIDELKEMLGSRCPIYRAMPNTAIAIGESMTCISFKESTAENQEFVEKLFNNLGKTVILEENLMDAATVLAACGTAFAMRFIRANIQGGIEIGFSAQTASLIAAQTIKGAAQLLLTNHTHPEHEIDKVTTPKGCTIAGLNEMEHQGFSSSLIKGIGVSYRKIKEV